MSRHSTLLLPFIASVLLDQATKYWAVQALAERQSTEVIPGVLFFTLTYNTGIAFGLLQKSLWLTVPVSAVVIVVAFVVYARSKARDIWMAAALGLLIGGAASNLYDRIAHGRVTDFLDLGWWPVFNVADSAITVAVVILAVRGLIASRDGRGQAPSEQATE